MLLPVELGPFEIDKLPYPNDPTKPARTGVSRDEARGLGQKEGARLCTELEWERACKGNDADLYAAGADSRFRARATRPGRRSGGRRSGRASSRAA